MQNGGLDDNNEGGKLQPEKGKKSIVGGGSDLLKSGGSKKTVKTWRSRSPVAQKMNRGAKDLHSPRKRGNISTPDNLASVGHQKH